MADINIILDSSPVQAVNGKIGFVNISAQDIVITGLATSGDLLNYATITNLATTGSTLQGQINNLGNIYATVTNLATTGSTLQTNVNTVATNLATTGSTLLGRISSLSGNAVLTNSNQTINGIKTFNDTGSFNTVQITNKKLSSYSYNINNFIFNNNYLNFVNSSNNITGILPNNIIDGINYYVKNLNTGILLITGSGKNTIDGFSSVNIYNNESLQLIGVNNFNYTGWVTISVDNGVS